MGRDNQQQQKKDSNKKENKRKNREKKLIGNEPGYDMEMKADNWVNLGLIPSAAG